MTGEDKAVGEPERLHPFFLLTGLGGALRGMAGGYAFVAYLAVSGRLGTALLAAGALLAILIVSTIIYWRRFEFRVGEDEIRIDSGIFSRTHRSIPFDRVQDVDIGQGPVARLLGLASVKLETGGSAGTEEGVLAAIPLERAEALRELVRARRSGAAAAVALDEAEAERPPVYAMDLQRLLLAGVFNFSLAIFAGLFGIAQTVGEAAGFNPFSRSFWETVASFSAPLQQFVLANQIAAAVAGLFVLVALGLATGIVRTTLRDYGFRLERSETGLRRRRGLLTLTDVTLPAKRAQAAILGTGPVRDSFGWRDLKMQSLARDEGGSGDHVLAPLATQDEADTILHALGWRPLPIDVEWARVSRAYVWTLLLALVPLYLLLAAQALALGWAWVVMDEVTRTYAFAELTPLVISFGITFAAVVLPIAARWLAWRRTGYALDLDRLLIRSGWWRRRTLVLPIRRIQSVDISHSFISRMFGTATLALGVAGGSGFSAHSIPALHAEKAGKLRDQLLSDLP